MDTVAMSSNVVAVERCGGKSEMYKAGGLISQVKSEDLIGHKALKPYSLKELGTLTEH